MSGAWRIVREAVRFDRTQLQIARGIRFAVGVGVPLFVGIATGHLVDGLAISVGAGLVGLTDSGSPYRRRVPAMLLAAAGAAVSTFVGELTGGYDVIAVALLTLWCFGAGMFIAISLPAYFVALMSPLAMTLVASYPGDARRSFEHGALVFAGGVLSIVLVLVLWRAHAHLPERAAIAKLYRALAAWVRGLHDADDRVPVLRALNGAREAIDAAEGRLAVPSPAGEAFRVLVDEADQIHLDVIALRNARERIETWDAGLAVRAFAPGRAAGADALAAVADALEACRWRADADSIRSRLDVSVDALGEELERRSAAGDVDHADELEAVLHRTASIRAELRSAVDLATSWQGEGTPPEDPVRHKRSRRPELGVHPPWPILRANLTRRSSAFRHAVRLSVTIALAGTIYRVFDLPRGYWVPLTVLFVLRPDYGSTFTRGLQRYVGTALGAVLATLIAAALNPGPYALAALATLVAVAIFAFLYANYALFTVSMTAWIIFLVALGGIPESATAIDRLLDTTIGATLTLALYALWPTWERSTLPDTTAALIEADRAYVHSLFESWFDRHACDSEAVRSARARARVARTNAEASVQRALFEPTGDQVGFGTADATGLLASLRRLADGALALEAHFEEDRPSAAPEEARMIARELDTALAELASAMRHRQPPADLPPLRETQQALAWRVGGETPLAEETDRIVNSIVVAAHILGRSTSPLSEVMTSTTAR
ncbi:MAG: FUSC family protein [Solirubrobacterales bacterium]|nr:FUSC family protein [Solirubrobacterales bacterium]